MKDFDRLIEHAFPLKQTSLDSVHEKNVRHGHLSTLHIWPARRPLAACRAALLATLLPDPGSPEERQKLCERIGGKVVTKIVKQNGEEREKEETEGGILHWGRETENAAELERLRKEVLAAYGGKAPKVLDPFAGGGAIPLEAMRLGCEATAVDINPVAWFVLKCTLEYPQRLSGKTMPLPDFILDDEEFMEAFYKAHPNLVGRTKKTKKQQSEEEGMLSFMVKEDSGRVPKADLAWQVRAWGRWVLKQARSELADLYPTYADFEPLKRKAGDPPGEVAFEARPMTLVPAREDGTPDLDALNGEFSEEYLKDRRNPRWVAKPTVAYLWARTVACKNCRASVPLLKTRWLCKKAKKRVLLEMSPRKDGTGVDFSVNAKAKAKDDASGTMSRAGAQCPCCGTIMTMEDLRAEGKAGRLSQEMTAVVVDGQEGKTYRIPTTHELDKAKNAEADLKQKFENIPFGIPDEPMPSSDALGFRVPLYGFDQWRKLFTSRQLILLGTFLKWTRSASGEMKGFSDEWAEAVRAYLAIGMDRIADRQSNVCRWDNGYSKLQGTFTRFALPMTWDFCEGNPFSDTTGNYIANLEWAAKYSTHAMDAGRSSPSPLVIRQSAIESHKAEYDCIVTDPPYYDAIPYSDLMDFFYIWLRRTLNGLSAEFNEVFKEPLSPKWDNDTGDGELIDDSSRHGGDKAKSKQAYEDGMAQVFKACHAALKPEGRLVIVFAHKHPDAWETLASAIIRAGFVVDGSWPIQTEMANRTRGLSSAALASSVWLVCRKRSPSARAGWDNRVLDEMRENIRGKLREFWDAGIRGPDFVWAATGPAMAAYSRHPVVKKANGPGVMSVNEFLTQVRRMVVDFVVGRVMAGEAAPGASDAADRLDEPTAYYLLHRHDFGLEEAPAGACILYAVSCGLSDRDLAGSLDLIAFGKGGSEGSGGMVKLCPWKQRTGKYLGLEAPGGRPVPMIDRVHRLMHLWKAGDLAKVDAYLDEHGLRRQELFKRLLQSIIELAPAGNEERALLESISNHLGARGARRDEAELFGGGEKE